MSRKRRIVGSIDKLQPALKDTVDQMLMSGESYRGYVLILPKMRSRSHRQVFADTLKDSLPTPNNFESHRKIFE